MNISITVTDIERYFFERNNGSFNFSYYYDLADTYEIETFRVWEDKMETLKALNRIFIVVSVFTTAVDFLLLLTIFSASVRERSASWYLYHLNFVTILLVTFFLPRLEGRLHTQFGTCMFFSFTEWVLGTMYYASLFLMDIEILATVFASDPRWQTSPRKRFFISMTTAWISCILFSVLVMFFGHKEHPHLPICFHKNQTAEILGHVVRIWIPLIVPVVLIIAGLVLFIRAKRSPENYRHMTINKDSLLLFNEWFACFMIWNMFIVFMAILMVNMHEQFITLGFLWDISIQMIVFILHISLPVGCLMLKPVRRTCKEWSIACFQFVAGIKRPSQTDSADTQILHMEAGE